MNRRYDKYGLFLSSMAPKFWIGSESICEVTWCHIYKFWSVWKFIRLITDTMEWGHEKDAGGGMHYWQNTRGQIAMVRSCDENRGWKLHEKNYDSRGQRTLQLRTTEEAMGRHHSDRHEVYPIKERAYCWLKEVEKRDPSGWPLPCKGLIQAGRR